MTCMHILSNKAEAVVGVGAEGAGGGRSFQSGDLLRGEGGERKLIGAHCLDKMYAILGSEISDDDQCFEQTGYSDLRTFHLHPLHDRVLAVGPRRLQALRVG